MTRLEITRKIYSISIINQNILGKPSEKVSSTIIDIGQRNKRGKGKPLKFQLLAKSFWTPSLPLQKRALRQKRKYYEPKSNYKVRFFSKFKTISSESWTSTILSIEVAPKPLVKLNFVAQIFQKGEKWVLDWTHKMLAGMHEMLGYSGCYLSLGGEFGPNLIKTGII